ncbi:glycosyltransferase family 4 protein [Pontibacter fetidus]|uniref:Glycosyltransferase family 4 protein n=1 Tax=Pontibacter fetidus TaxID=2700082 RepID=A0A6B2HC06_9BACT|nr:glycosyltransferase family 4 protein [Pontibacter fetidus]NDK57512.1 glycosyltransferase family 4 protein [Pontibacter fetidus]
MKSLQVLMIGENIHQSKGGIVTVMKQLLHDRSDSKQINYKPIFTTGDGFTTPKKVRGWLVAYLKYLLYLPSYKLIHVHHAANLNFWLTAFFVYVAKFLRRKVILHNHGADFKDFYNNCSKKRQLKIKEIFEKASANIVLSNSWLEWYTNIAPNANWILLPNAISIPCDVNVKKLIKDEVILVYLARIEERKGFYDMLEVMPKFFSAYPNAQLFIAGQGDLIKVNKLLNEYKISDNIEVLGYINQKQKDELLRKAHLLLLPSYDEGLPMALLEAMSYAVVPITTPVGGIPDVICNGTNGLMHEPGDKEGLLRSIEQLLTNPNGYSLMSGCAYKTVADNFNLKIYDERLKDIYHTCLNQ